MNHLSAPRRRLLVRLYLRVLLGSRDGRAAWTELEELYHHRYRRDGARSANRWWRRQVVQYPVRLLIDRTRTLRAPEPGPIRRDRSTRFGAGMLHIVGDLRHSLRGLAKAPVFTLTIVSTVAVGIGGTTAVFSVVDAVLVQPLPYPDSDRLWRVYTESRENKWPFSVADYLALEEQQTSFAAVAAYQARTMTLNIGDLSERISARLVTPGYFTLLGIRPLLGRVFDPDDGHLGAERTVVVSHEFWNRVLGGDEDVIGHTIPLNAESYTLIGVLPREVGPLETGRDVFPALQLEQPRRKGPFFLTAIVRLQDNVDIGVARVEMRAINRRLFPVWQETYRDRESSWGMTDLKHFVIGDSRPMVLVAFGAVLFLLLIASTNVANLLVTRATQRHRELAVRAALGASRQRLMQHVFAESTVLTIAGSALALLVALGGIRLVTSLGADFLPRAFEIGFTGSVLRFFAGVIVGSGLLFGLIPALSATSAGFDPRLGSLETRNRTSRASRRLRHGLVAIQFIVVVPLLIGAGLLLASLSKLQRVDPGFDTTNVITLRISLPPNTYPVSDGTLSTFWATALDRIAALPGIQAAGLSVGRPPVQYPMMNNQNLEDHPTPPGETQINVPWNFASPELFDALEVPLLSGRMFDLRDTTGVIVDATWAQRFFPDEDAVGKRFLQGGCTVEACGWMTVVGVVGSVKYTGLENPDLGTVYVNFDIRPDWTPYVIARTTTDPLAVVPSMKGIIRDLDPTLPVSDVATMNELIHDSLVSPRYLTLLVAGFGAVALLLSLIGIYGIIAFFVERHTRDIGIRLALGSGRPAVVRFVIGQGMRLVTLGMAIGLIVALSLTRLMSTLLFDVRATDPGAFTIASLAILVTALTACWIPARHAARLDPAVTLREE